MTYSLIYTPEERCDRSRTEIYMDHKNTAVRVNKNTFTASVYFTDKVRLRRPLLVTLLTNVCSYGGVRKFVKVQL